MTAVLPLDSGDGASGPSSSGAYTIPLQLRDSSSANQGGQLDSKLVWGIAAVAAAGECWPLLLAFLGAEARFFRVAIIDLVK